MRPFGFLIAERINVHVAMKVLDYGEGSIIVVYAVKLFVGLAVKRLS